MNPNSPSDAEGTTGNVDDKNIDVSQNTSDDEGQGSSSSGSPAEGNQDDNKPKDIGAAVRAALAPKEEQSSGSGDDEGEKPGSDDPNKAKAEEGEDDPAELTDEEFSSLKPKTQRRIKHLIKQAETLSAQVGDLTSKAEGFDNIQRFTKEANLTREDVNTGFNIMKLMRNEPAKAYKALKPIWDTLCDLTGVGNLPADLVEQVENGEITAERAQELSQLRASQHLQTQQEKEAQERRDKDAEEGQAQSLAELKTNVSTALTSWETQWRGSDPDYSLKQGRVMEAIEFELLKREKSRTLPTTAEEAVKLAKDVRKKVEDELKKFTPKKSSMKPVTGVGATSGSKPVAKSIFDAVAQAVGHA